MPERKLWDEILAARDETRLQLHLAGLEAKTAFEKLDARIEAFANKAGLELEKVGDEIADETQITLAELRADLKDVREKLKKAKP